MNLLPTDLENMTNVRVMSITGAGISVGSGLPTYRGVDGHYTDIVKELKRPIEEIVSLNTLKKEPEVLWRHWHHLLLSLKSAVPSAAHHALKRIGDACGDYLELTQNVDGLSLAAGLDRSCLVEIHGSTHSFSCFRCGAKHQLDITEDMELPPRCYECKRPAQAPIRPDVVLFGEDIRQDNFNKALRHARSTNLLIISGTTLQFAYLIDFISAAALNSAKILYVDPQANVDNPMLYYVPSQLEIHSKIHCIQNTADEVLPKIATYLESRAPLAGLVKAIL
jgi:NAD-dependent deacetylase